VISLGFLAGTVAGHRKIIQKTSDVTTPLDELINLQNAMVWVASISMWSAKVPILLLYIQIFGIKRWVRFASYTLIAATGIVFLIFSAITYARCDPGDAPIDLTFIGTCIKQATDSGLALRITSITTDVIIFLMPIPLILSLNLSTRRKIGVSLVFSSGLIAIAASGISAHFKRRSRDGQPGGASGAMICTVIDSAVALMVGCVPSLNSFWSRTIVTSPLYASISKLSQRSLVRLRSIPTSTSASNGRTKISTDSSEHFNRSNLHKADVHYEQDIGMDSITQFPLQDLNKSSQRGTA
jgi:hypothetical protein